MVERGSWSIPAEDGGWRYSRYSALPSLLGVPLYAAARAALPPEPEERRRRLLQAAVTLQTPLVTAATGAVLFSGLARLGVGAGAALATALVFAFGTLALPYSGTLYGQPLAALGTAALVLSLARGASGRAGFALALLVAVRLEALALLPALVLCEWRHAVPRTRSLRPIALGAAAGVAVNVVENLARGDAALMRDYDAYGFTTPLLLGLHGLLLSPGKGLVWFAPAAALGLGLLPWLARRAPRVGFLAGSTAAVFLVTAAGWWAWHGGGSVGPRLLVPALPVLVLPLAWLLEGWHALRAPARVALLALMLLSAAVQGWNLVGRGPERVPAPPPLRASETEALYLPQRGHWNPENRAWIEPVLVQLWRDEPAWRVPVAVAALALLAGAGLGLAGAARSCGLALRRDALLPAPDRSGWSWIGVALGIFAAPWLASALLARGGPTPSGVPEQLSRLTLGEDGAQLRGRLYLPVRGRYVLLQRGEAPVRIRLGGAPLVRRRSSPAWGFTPILPRGFHELELASRRPGHFNELLWTAPGNAYHEQAIPRRYLTGPQPDGADRVAIRVAESQWIVWVLGATVLLFRWATPRAGPVPGPGPGPGDAAR